MVDHKNSKRISAKLAERKILSNAVLGTVIAIATLNVVLLALDMNNARGYVGAVAALAAGCWAMLGCAKRMAKADKQQRGE